MKTLFITSFHPHISRNILSTDVLKILTAQKNLRLVIIVPDYKTDYFQRNFGRDNVLVKGVNLYLASKTKIGLFFKRLGFFFFDTKTARAKKRYQYLCRQKYLIYAFSILMGALSHIFALRKIVRYLDFRLSSKNLYSEIFEQYQPDALFATDIQNENDVAFMQEARQRKIPILGMLRSWDNPTQRVIRVLPDKFLIGSQTLKEEVIDLYHYPGEWIVITGNPHYDRYLKGPITSKEKFFAQFNMDFSKKMILYAPVGDHMLRKNDVDQYAMEILREIDAQILVRFPPDEAVTLNNFSRPADMFYDQPGVSFKSDQFGDREISRQDDDRLIDSIYWCDLAITGPTSICLDAALLDKPVIAINFYPTPRDFCDSIFNYWYDHTEKLLKTGGVSYVTSKEEFLKAIDDYLRNPEKDKKGRAAIRTLWFSHADGKSGERLAKQIISFLNL